MYFFLHFNLNPTSFLYIPDNQRPPTCRFTGICSSDTTDVLDVQSDLHDKNLYAYCDNNPVTRADSSGKLWFTVAGAIVGGILGGASKAIANLMVGNELSSGVLGAGVGGAVYGGIATSPMLRTTIGKHVNAIASYTSAAAESIFNEASTYVKGKPITVKNIKQSTLSIVTDVVVEGTQTYIAGKIASCKVKTNNGWFRPQKIKSAFTGSYAKKTWMQSSVQTVAITVFNTVRGWFG